MSIYGLHLLSRSMDRSQASIRRSRYVRDNGMHRLTMLVLTVLAPLAAIIVWVAITVH